MKEIERIKCVKCMEFLARQINDEEIFINNWLSLGVADGDIEYGDLSCSLTENDEAICYIDDDTFADLMDTFLFVMQRARESGGLYCDGVVSRDCS